MMKTLKNLSTAALVALAATSLLSCTSKNEQKAKVVNLAIWGNYLSEELQKKFSETTGIKINISNYSSNEELLAKVQSGSTGIDLAVPSDYMVEIMAKMGVIETLDKSQIPNFEQLSPDWKGKAYDPENKYSVPYAWSTTGIAINRDLFKGTIKGWKDLFNNPELAGKVSLLDDVREVTGAALKSLNLSLNTKNSDDLKKAEKVLLDMKPRLKMFRSDTSEALLNKEVAVAQSYSTDALQAAAKSHGKIEYVIPEEGSSLAIDNIVILKGAKNLAEAHQLINFMLSPEVNQKFVQTVFGGPVLKSTRENLPKELQNNPALFPQASLLKNMEGIRDLGDATALYDSVWTKIKTQ